MQEEIFGISLDDEGRGQIVQLHKKVRLIFIGAIIWSLLNLLVILARFNSMGQLAGYSKTSSRIVVMYFFLLLSVILLPFQTYYYYAFQSK